MLGTSIFAFDPGKTTGVCSAIIHDGLPAPDSQGPKNPKMQWGAELKTGDDWMAVYKRLSDHRPKMVVLEKFRIFPWKAKELGWDEVPAAVYRGYVEAFCLILGLPVYYQSSSEMNSFAQVGVLAETFGLLTRELPASEHIRDAMRHVAMMHYRVWKQGVRAPK